MNKMQIVKNGKRVLFRICGIDYTAKEGIERCRQIKLRHLIDRNLDKFTDDEYFFISSVLLHRKEDVGFPIRIKLDAPANISESRKKMFYETDYCFHYINKNGKWDDFSFIKAFSSKGAILEGNINKAFRFEVYDKIDEVRNRYGLGYEEHVDHVFPYIAILRIFLKENGLKYEDIDVEQVLDYRFVSYRLIDRELAKRWQDFHNKYATLRPLSAKENLKKSHDDKIVSRTLTEMGYAEASIRDKNF